MKSDQFPPKPPIFFFRYQRSAQRSETGSWWESLSNIFVVRSEVLPNSFHLDTSEPVVQASASSPPAARPPRLSQDIKAEPSESQDPAPRLRQPLHAAQQPQPYQPRRINPPGGCAKLFAPCSAWWVLFCSSDPRQMHLQRAGVYLRGDGTNVNMERHFTWTAHVGKVLED